MAFTEYTCSVDIQVPKTYLSVLPKSPFPVNLEDNGYFPDPLC